MGAARAVEDGWNSLKESFRMWGITAREHLTLVEESRVPRHATWEPHWSAQEFTMTEASRSDARVSLLEVSFVATTMSVASQTVPCWQHRGRRRGPHTMPPGSWEQLDDVNARDVFLKRIPRLNICRGRLREGFGFALREKWRAKHEGDAVGESRVWKLFTPRIPIAILEKLLEVEPLRPLLPFVCTQKFQIIWWTMKRRREMWQQEGANKETR